MNDNENKKIILKNSDYILLTKKEFNYLCRRLQIKSIDEMREAFKDFETININNILDFKIEKLKDCELELLIKLGLFECHFRHIDISDIVDFYKSIN